MEEKHKIAVEEYQCPGCVCGMDISCYKPSEDIACERHVAGTMIYPIIGSVFLGMPKGFNRLGRPYEGKLFNLNIFDNFNDGWDYDMFNVPAWKHKDKHGNTIVRGLNPRFNRPFLHIFLEDCIDRILCFQITDLDLDGMD